MITPTYQVPDFSTLKAYDERHYELVLVPTKVTGTNRVYVSPAHLHTDLPLPLLRHFDDRTAMVLMNEGIERLKLGTPHIFLLRFSKKKEDQRKYWIVADCAMPVSDFAVSSMVEKAIQTWRFDFVREPMKKLYAKYGEYSLMVLTHNREAAQEVLKLNEPQYNRLMREWGNLRQHWHELRVLFRFGFEHKIANFIIDAYRGSDSGMNKHPFRLAQKEGIKPVVLARFFKAMGVQTARNDELETNARDFLDERVELNGATAVEISEAASGISESFGIDRSRIELLLHDMVMYERCDYRYSGDLSTVSMGKSLRNDLSIADSIAARIAPHPDAVPYQDYKGDKKPDGTFIELNQEQKVAIYLALNNKTSIITGGPGTGKTTTAKTLIREVKAHNPKSRVLLAAPTGKAARRMSEVTGLPCVTLHRMLGMAPGTTSMLTSFGDNDTLIIDEMSMVDLHLFANVVRHFQERGRLVLLGDADQLASVESGDVLNDLIHSCRVPTARLTDVQRTAAESYITSGAYKVLAGEMPEFKKDLHFIKVQDSTDILKQVKNLVRTVLPEQFGIESANVQILAAQKVKACGVSELNRELKDIFNPQGHLRREHRQLGYTHYHVGDRVMYLKNRYDRDVQNGECGIVMGFDEDNECMHIDFDGKQVKMPYADYQELMHAWAVTVHKSQGSECDCVIVVLPREHNFMLTRNLVFTAMTRGKKHVFFVGEEQVLDNVLKNKATPKRRTHLSFMVAEAHDRNARSELIRGMLGPLPKPSLKQMFERTDLIEHEAVKVAPDTALEPLKPRSRRYDRASDITVPF